MGTDQDGEKTYLSFDPFYQAGVGVKDLIQTTVTGTTDSLRQKMWPQPSILVTPGSSCVSRAGLNISKNGTRQIGQ